jgi:hypothetical protein
VERDQVPVVKLLTSRLVWAAAAALACCLLAIPAADLYYRSSRGEGCARCHEIRPNLVSWKGSTHRKLNCTDCHESTTGANLRRMQTHFSGEIPEQIRLGAEDVFLIAEKCRKCHQQEFAQWSAGAHSATYARIFTTAEHNRKRLLMDDCFRCHGMHFEGPIGAVVQPVDTKGPWTLARERLASRPAIPCLACHAMHREGEPLTRPAERVAAKEETMRPSLGLFDRRSRLNIRAAVLPLPVMYDGERRVKISPDARQALCYQCHAALSTAQAGSADDRTPIGVHEGLSCLACHQKHSQNTRQSCASCHPRLSNCGLDVEKMDTTFANRKSRHNIHFVKCADCHPKGVPKKKAEPSTRAAL